MSVVLPGGGVALPDGLGHLFSHFNGRAFGVTAPGPESEWQVLVEQANASHTTVVGKSRALNFSVRRKYLFRADADATFDLHVHVFITFPHHDPRQQPRKHQSWR